MRLKEIHFKNFGPIKTGKIKQNKINVFFGPNNSGKSLTSLLIHGINSTHSPPKLPPIPFVKRYQQQKSIDLHNLHLHTMLRRSGISIFDVISYGKRNCSIHVEFPRKKPLDFTISAKNLNNVYGIEDRLSHIILQKLQNTYESVYIPAGRTGTIQFFTNIIQIRNQLLNDLLQTFGGNRSVVPNKTTAEDIRSFARSTIQLPDNLEQFYNLILSSQTDNLDKNIQKAFSDIFPGTVELSKSQGGLPYLVYKDPTKFQTKLESAGSGTVAAFPIIAGMHYVEFGGTLIVEEPEAHLEPSKQLQLLEILQEASYSKNVNLIFTTHSDYIVKKLLALVSRRKIKRSDLNLYYFNRPDGALTTIEQIDVGISGESEQPTFDKATDQLIGEFSI